MNCSSVLDQFMGLELKGLKYRCRDIDFFDFEKKLM